MASRGVRASRVVGGCGGTTGGMSALGAAVAGLAAGTSEVSLSKPLFRGLEDGGGVGFVGGGVDSFATGDGGAFVGGVVVRAGHNGSVRGRRRNGRVGGRSVFAGRLGGGGVGFAADSPPVLVVELERDGKSFVSGLRSEAVTRRGDNGLVGGLVVAAGEGNGEARRVESGPVGGLPVVVVDDVEDAAVEVAGDMRRALGRPMVDCLGAADSTGAEACDALPCSLFKISCARVFVWLSFVTSSMACCTCAGFAPTINSYKSSAPFTSMNFSARAKSRRA